MTWRRSPRWLALPGFQRQHFPPRRTLHQSRVVGGGPCGHSYAPEDASEALKGGVAGAQVANRLARAPSRSSGAARCRCCGGLALPWATVRSRAGRPRRAADDGRHRERHVANAVAAVLHARDRQDAAAVERDRLRSRREWRCRRRSRRPPFFLITSAPDALGAREQLVGRGWRSSRETCPAAGRRSWRSTRSAPCCRRARRGSAP